MAVRKVTFSIPKEIANQLVHRVPARERSKFVARALKESLRKSDEALVRACLLANRDKDARAIEREFGRIKDVMVEPWDDAAEG